MRIIEKPSCCENLKSDIGPEFRRVIVENTAIPTTSASRDTGTWMVTVGH